MASESHRIADQLRRAFAGEAWHGPPLRDALTGVTAEQAQARPLPSAHSIWELVLHIDIWVQVALEALHGVPMPKLYGTEKDCPGVADGSAAAWSSVQERMFHSAEQLAKSIETFPEARLPEIVPGRTYDFYHLFHGIVQHSLYHGGQIAMLKRAV